MVKADARAGRVRRTAKAMVPVGGERRAIRFFIGVYVVGSFLVFMVFLLGCSGCWEAAWHQLGCDDAFVFSVALQR